MPAPVTCPGCGLTGPPLEPDPRPDRRYRNSAACWAGFGELSGHTVGAATGGFFHQTAVDAYNCQHCPAGAAMMLWFGLLGLHLVFEQGCSGAQVQRAHVALARVRPVYPQLGPIPARSAGSACDVALRVPVVGAQQAVEEWGRRVWEAYIPAHSLVEAWVASLPGPVQAAAHR